jgi:hypothetical protein
MENIEGPSADYSKYASQAAAIRHGDGETA